MPKIELNFKEVSALLTGSKVNFPIYTSQIINLANQNAQGTRPKVVGKMSELFKEFEKSGRPKILTEWVTWYEDRMPNAIDEATRKTYSMVQNIKEAAQTITPDLVRRWMKDLLNKTFIGLSYQETILKKIAEIKKVPYRFATPEEESKGIDGHIGNDPVSIKPVTYKTKNMLSEKINAKIIYYEKTEDGIVFEYDF